MHRPRRWPLCLQVAAATRRAAQRPPARQLTAFYLAIALGGALGGIFNGLVAPAVFDRVALRRTALLPPPTGRMRGWAFASDGERLDVQVLMITAHASVSSAVEAMRHGACDYIEKPFDVVALEKSVSQACDRRRVCATTI